MHEQVPCETRDRTPAVRDQSRHVGRSLVTTLADDLVVLPATRHQHPTQRSSGRRTTAAPVALRIGLAERDLRSVRTGEGFVRQGALPQIRRVIGSQFYDADLVTEDGCNDRMTTLMCADREALALGGGDVAEPELPIGVSLSVGWRGDDPDTGKVARSQALAGAGGAAAKGISPLPRSDGLGGLRSARRSRRPSPSRRRRIAQRWRRTRSWQR